MNELLIGLLPAFVAGLAVQQFLEMVDVPVEKLAGAYKKAALGVAALAIGVALALFAGIRVLAPITGEAPAWADVLVTGLIVSGGTETFNSVLKFLGYAKEKQEAEKDIKKVEAAEKKIEAEQVLTTLGNGAGSKGEQALKKILR